MALTLSKIELYRTLLRTYYLCQGLTNTDQSKRAEFQTKINELMGDHEISFNDFPFAKDKKNGDFAERFENVADTEMNEAEADALFSFIAFVLRNKLEYQEATDKVSFVDTAGEVYEHEAVPVSELFTFAQTLTSFVDKKLSNKLPEPSEVKTQILEKLSIWELSAHDKNINANLKPSGLSKEMENAFITIQNMIKQQEQTIAFAKTGKVLCTAVCFLIGLYIALAAFGALCDGDFLDLHTKSYDNDHSNDKSISSGSLLGGLLSLFIIPFIGFCASDAYYRNEQKSDVKAVATAISNSSAAENSVSTAEGTDGITTAKGVFFKFTRAEVENPTIIELQPEAEDNALHGAGSVPVADEGTSLLLARSPSINR